MANRKTIRYELGTRGAPQFSIIPELNLSIANTVDYLERMDELIKQ